MKVLLCTHDLHDKGGTTSMFDCLYETLYEKYDLTICTFSTSSKESFKKSSYEKRVYRNKNYFHFFRYFSFIEYLRYKPSRSLKNYLLNFDIIFLVSGIPIWYNLIKNTKSKKIVWYATSISEDRKDRIKNQKFLFKLYHILNLYFLKRIEKNFLRENTKFFALSKYAKNLYPKLKSEVLNYPIKVNNIVNKKDTKTILSVSRFLDPRKNIMCLLRAFKLLHQSDNKFKLFIIGDEINETIINFIEENRLSDNIFFENFIPQNQLLNYYKKCEYFVLTSNEEGLGIVILEAINNGCLVISTKCGGPENIITNKINGFLVDKDDHIAITKKIIELDDNAENKNLIKKNAIMSLQNSNNFDLFKKKISALL
jgi:glycosyltransferase involved in cell wall biosynthesis